MIGFRFLWVFPKSKASNTQRNIYQKEEEGARRKNRRSWRKTQKAADKTGTARFIVL